MRKLLPAPCIFTNYLDLSILAIGKYILSGLHENEDQLLEQLLRLGPLVLAIEPDCHPQLALDLVALDVELNADKLQLEAVALVLGSVGFQQCLLEVLLEFVQTGQDLPVVLEDPLYCP